MKILAIEKEIKRKKPGDFKPHLKDEALKVWQFYRNETIREIYFVKDRKIAVLILECDNEQEAEKVLNKLPLVKEKLIKFEIFPLAPYDGFERLFKL
jgi:hypothetical protein